LKSKSPRVASSRLVLISALCVTQQLRAISLERCSKNAAIVATLGREWAGRVKVTHKMDSDRSNRCILCVTQANELFPSRAELSCVSTRLDWEAQRLDSTRLASLTNISIAARCSARISESWLDSDRSDRAEPSFEFSSRESHV